MQAQGQGGGDNGKRQGMLAVNDLNYVLSPDLSVSVNNTYKNHFFQSTEYTHRQRGICILNTGADYADTRTSSLEFTLRIPDTAVAAAFGKHGSAINVIKTITISTRSGDEVARITDLNHLSAMTNGFKYSEDWMTTVGQAAGFGGMVFQSGHVASDAQFSIPLYLLTEFFGYGRLTPAMVMAGMRIELEWEDPSVAFQAFNTGSDTAASQSVTGYTIVNPYISIRSVQLTDGSQRALNEMSAVNGLEIVYCDWERTEVSADTNRFHTEVRKAASRALKAFAAVRPNNTAADEGKVDSFSTEAWDAVRWQWQLGSLYFPQQPISNDSPRLTLPETYKHTLVACNTYKPEVGKRSSVPFRDNCNYLQQNIGETIADPADLAAVADQLKFEQRTGHDFSDNTSTPWTEYANARLGTAASDAGRNGTFCNGRSTVAVTLERSDLFNLTGVPINNARVLALQMEFLTTVSRKMTIFLKYVRLARVFLNNTEVEQ
jgi:hypothetical protein